MEISTSYDSDLELKNRYNDSKLFDFNRGKGLMWMMVSVLMNTIMNVIVKTTIVNVSVLEASTIRAVYLAIGCAAHLHRDKMTIMDFPRQLSKLLFLRAWFGFCAVTSLYIALEYLSMSTAASLYFTSPIITAILCYYLLGERLPHLEIVGIFSSMFGVVLLTQPSLFFPTPGEPRMIHHHLGDKTHMVGVGFALFGSLNNALVFVCCRKLGTQVH